MTDLERELIANLKANNAAMNNLLIWFKRYNASNAVSVSTSTIEVLIEKNEKLLKKALDGDFKKA